MGGPCIGRGAAIYFRCAWEFAVRGLGTPPTKYLVTTALHRYVRNPMYIGVFLVLLGEAALFHSMKLLGYAAFFSEIRCAARALIPGEHAVARRRLTGDMLANSTFCRV